jgi:anhydro-N-acetylmuramic acid kinase
MAQELYIGLMSGTSLDGVDGVLAQFDDAPGEPVLRVLGHAHRPFDEALRAELLALNAPGANELHRCALAGNALARLYADLVQDLRSRADAPVRAIGAHGQTVRHRPGHFDGVGYTLQLNAPALLAELTGLDVVADFRSRDVAAGGQGAPLVPAFHKAVFARGHRSAVLNVGGMANITVLDEDGTFGFDCGPGNVLIDLWCMRHLHRPYDSDGAWAAGGRVMEPLLAAALHEPFFSAAPPKSTGRDDFNAAWLDALIARVPQASSASAQDIQATLTELTARAAAVQIKAFAPRAQELIVCGGGALNAELMRRLASQLAGLPVASSAERGLPPLQVEAAAFAWLARAFMRAEPGNLPRATGARGLRVLGSLYPGA